LAQGLKNYSAATSLAFSLYFHFGYWSSGTKERKRWVVGQGYWSSAQMLTAIRNLSHLSYLFFNLIYH